MLYATLIDSLQEYKSVVVDTRNRSDIESTVGYEVLIQKGIVVTIRARIINKSGSIIGFIGIDYTSSPTEETVMDAVHIIEDTAVKIGTLLSIEEG